MQKQNITFTDGSTVIPASWLNGIQENQNEIIDILNGPGATVYISGKSNNNAYGSVSVYGAKDMNCDKYAAKKNEYVTLKAIPSTGYTFSAWTDGNTQNPRTVLATETKEYTANFTSGTVQITASCEATQGTVTGGGSKEIGASVTLTASAKNGYQFKQWKVGTEVVSTSATYTFNAPSVDTTYVAEFQEAEIGDIEITAETDENYSYIKITGIEAANADTYKLVIDGTEEAFDATTGKTINAQATVVVKASNSVTNKTRQTSTVTLTLDATTVKAKSTAVSHVSTTSPATEEDQTVPANSDITITADGTTTYILSDGKNFSIKVGGNA